MTSLLDTHDPHSIATADDGVCRDGYAARFSGVFKRADQERWFGLYLRGLLGRDARKNVESIAAHVAASVPESEGVAQALQHFISNSPWDANQVVATYRNVLPDKVRGPGVWVVNDGIIEKKGRHSVGTQRQFARSLGRKVNCQIAVVVGRFGMSGYVPLAVRLYLPGYWLRENRTAIEKTVPKEWRTPAGKPQIALELIAELRREGWPGGGLVGEGGYAADENFRDSLAAHALQLSADENHPDALPAASVGFGRLRSEFGLDHFEGRTWVGWHHHTALVLAALGYRIAQATSRS